jgi:hypothetical protein
LVEDSDGARVIYVEGVNIPIIAVKRDDGYNYFSTDLVSLWLVSFLQVFFTYLSDQTLLLIIICQFFFMPISIFLLLSKNRT